VVPRDADMQEEEAGEALAWREGEALVRGDLVFWEGHVGIMTGPQDFIHANAHHMAVEKETLRQAANRIAAATGFKISAVRRLLRKP
jgi:cell wall-associated NlpC family hydrolase